MIFAFSKCPSFLTALFLMSVLQLSCARAHENPSDKPALIDSLLSKFSRYGKFNGSVLVAEKGEVVFKKGYGWANMEWNIPNQPDTKHRLASVTKQFTAMLVVQLAAAEKLDLHAPISTYLPDYPKEQANRITIHHLLTHRSGIPNYTWFSNYREVMPRHNSPDALTRLFADSALLFPPGERFSYSNSGYVLLGVIVEKITGLTFADALRENIFNPLGMDNTGCEIHSAIVKNRSSGYYPMGLSIQHAAYIEMSTPFSAGAIYSTVEDLFLWDQALYGDQLLPDEWKKLLFENYGSDGPRYYGYGWEMDIMAVGSSNVVKNTIGHSGGINGYTSSIIRIPEDSILVVILNNTGGTPLNEMTKAITGILYDQPYYEPKPSLAYALLSVIKDEGLEKGLEFYSRTHLQLEYELLEEEMNLAGYDLLEAGEIHSAAEVFKRNIEKNPHSFNAYDSYGEALLLLGDTVNAVANYQKSIELNPGNNNGIRVLEEFGVE